MKIKIFVIAVVWLMSGFLSAQAQSSPCGCENKAAAADAIKILLRDSKGIDEKVKWN